MEPFKGLETGDLHLRPPETRDAQAIFDEYARDLDVTRYLAWRPHRDLEETIAFVQARKREWQCANGRFSWVMTRTDDEPIGMLSIRVLAPFRVSMAYVLAKSYWGNGYMTEVAETVADWFLKQDDIYRVEAYCDVGNHASARVLEKIGMKKEGILRRAGFAPNLSDEPRDAICYAKVT